jgi:hypothetical protein
MTPESFRNRQEPLSVHTERDLEAIHDIEVPTETQAGITVIPNDQTTNLPVAPSREKDDWEKYRDGEGPYPWHLE